MKRSNKLIVSLAWVQLVISLMLASAIGWGYMTYQSSTGQFVRSLAASIGAVSSVVIRTAETIEASKELLVETEQTLAITRERITELGAVTGRLSANVPKIADSIGEVATFVGKVGVTLEATGDNLMRLAVPTSIHWVGLKPIVESSHPLERQAEEFKKNGKELKAAGESLSGASDFLRHDGNGLANKTIATTQQALRQITEVERILQRLKKDDLPKAVADLKETTRDLRDASARAGLASNVGLVLLLVGLLLAAWCFVQSVGTLLLVRSLALDSEVATTTVIINS